MSVTVIVFLVFAIAFSQNVQNLQNTYNNDTIVNYLKRVLRSIQEFSKTTDAVRALDSDQIKDVQARLEDILRLDLNYPMNNTDINSYTGEYESIENRNKVHHDPMDTMESPEQSPVKIDINYILDLVKNLTDKEFFGFDTTGHEVLLENARRGPQKRWFWFWKKTTKRTTRTWYERWSTKGPPNLTFSTAVKPYDYEEPNELKFPLIAKCFICGLDSTYIPYGAECGHALDNNMLSIFPIDTKAKEKIGLYRKHCHTINIHPPVADPEKPKRIFGNFTGGCSVRWVDISDAYTQRTCRNRYKPFMGKNLASKRMARLELALNKEDNGCIVSPMATLLPLSRDISLYAYFHACVCTGTFCNRTMLSLQCNLYTIVISLIILYNVIHLFTIPNY